MDSSQWLQGAVSDNMDSSPMGTPMTGDDTVMICTGNLMERRSLRPPDDQLPQCPRCDSTNTKFCYYNNYSLSQPRYYCKSCRRYWTKGGTLRNIPVGGGCRKTRKTSKKPSASDLSPSIQYNAYDGASPSPSPSPSPFLCYSGSGSTDLQLAFPEQLHFSGMFNNGDGAIANPNLNPIDFAGNKYIALTDGHDLIGNDGLGADRVADYFYDIYSAEAGHCSSAAATVLESFQPYDQNPDRHYLDQMVDMKPGHNLMHAACTSDAGYGVGEFGSWTGFGSSATKRLV